MGKIKDLMIDKMNAERTYASADEPCHICEVLKDEYGQCNCSESWV